MIRLNNGHIVYFPYWRLYAPFKSNQNNAKRAKNKKKKLDFRRFARILCFAPGYFSNAMPTLFH